MKIRTFRTTAATATRTALAATALAAMLTLSACSGDTEEPKGDDKGAAAEQTPAEEEPGQESETPAEEEGASPSATPSLSDQQKDAFLGALQAAGVKPPANEQEEQEQAELAAEVCADQQGGVPEEESVAKLEKGLDIPNEKAQAIYTTGKPLCSTPQ